jgi:hypothetical protein
MVHSASVGEEQLSLRASITIGSSFCEATICRSV